MSERQKLGPREVRERKGGVGGKLTMLSVYDFPMARLAEAAGIDILLVGDSLAMVGLGYASTVPVTMEEMLHHTRAVVRGAPNTLVVADLPFLSYHLSDAQAIENAGRLLKEGGADTVKLEGGRAMADRVRAIATAGIPVMGHIGLTPQTAVSLGGLKTQGRDLASARAILADAAAVAEAGAFAIVVEAVPAVLGAQITQRVPVPTIGIGAGVECDGQVLLATDLLGLHPDAPQPKFAKRYAELGEAAKAAFAEFAAEVRSGAYPDAAHSYQMKPAVAAALRAEADGERE